MAGSEFDITGVDGVIARLKTLDFEVKRKTGRSALRKAAQVVQKAAIANAQSINDPKTSEEIAKNIAIRWNGKLYKRTQNLGFRVGVMGGAKGAAKASGEFAGKGKAKNNPGGDTFYWRFVEYGTKDIPAHPFMRPALENNIQAATTEFATQFEKGIERAIKRGAKK